jgi:hypothetical protein
MDRVRKTREAAGLDRQIVDGVEDIERYIPRTVSLDRQTLLRIQTGPSSDLG